MSSKPTTITHDKEKYQIITFQKPKPANVFYFCWIELNHFCEKSQKWLRDYQRWCCINFCLSTNHLFQLWFFASGILTLTFQSIFQQVWLYNKVFSLISPVISVFGTKFKTFILEFDYIFWWSCYLQTAICLYTWERGKNITALPSTAAWFNTFGLTLPEAAGGVLEDGGPLGVAGLWVLVWLVLPPRVGNNDLVGQGLHAMVDDHHLQRFIGRQIPQGSYREQNTRKIYRHTW